MKVLVLSITQSLSFLVIIGILIFHFVSLKRCRRACVVTEEAIIKKCVGAAMAYNTNTITTTSSGTKYKVIAEDYRR
jgi:hypothetical protein